MGFDIPAKILIKIVKCFTDCRGIYIKSYNNE